jgi:hypothetical protein
MMLRLLRVVSLMMLLFRRLVDETTRNNQSTEKQSETVKEEYPDIYIHMSYQNPVQYYDAPTSCTFLVTFGLQASLPTPSFADVPLPTPSACS